MKIVSNFCYKYVSKKGCTPCESQKICHVNIKLELCFQYCKYLANSCVEVNSEKPGKVPTAGLQTLLLTVY